MGKITKANEEQSSGLSRRDFLKGAAAGTMGMAVVGALNACANPAAETEYVYKDQDAEGAKKEWAFEKAPAAIGNVQSGGDYDLIVIGSGMSGLTTAWHAKNTKPDLKVLLITGAAPNCGLSEQELGAGLTNPHAAVWRGGSNSSKWSKVMAEYRSKNLLNYDESSPQYLEYLNREKLAASYRVDQQKWSKFYNDSKEAMNWLIDFVTDKGAAAVTLEVDNYDETLKSQTVAHAFMAPGTVEAQAFMVSTGQGNVVWALAADLVAKGVTIKSQMPARRLIRGGQQSGKTGKIEGVVAEDLTTHTFYQFNAPKVVLATGDFSADPDMMAKYCSWVLPIVNFDAAPKDDTIYSTCFAAGNPIYRGDGHKMGLWVGAAWQNITPNAPMIQGSIGFFGSTGSYQPLGFHQGLVVNTKGERFYNEDISLPYAATLLLNQPGMKAFGIWSEAWYDTVIAAGRNFYSFGSSYNNPPPPKSAGGFGGIVDSWEGGIKADNLKALCAHERVNLPYDKVLAAVQRYNELVSGGTDLDFGKNSALLCQVNPDAKLYAAVNEPTFMTVMGGLRTDEHMRVCDADNQPIPGLYNVGQMVGDVFANTYNFAIPGHSYGGNCLTFGRRLGIEIGEGTV